MIARGNVPTGDAIGLGQLTGYLGVLGKPFRIRGVSDVTYSDLKEADTILVGYFSNPWTLELHKHTRFHLQHIVGGNIVADREQPSRRDWIMNGGWPLLKNEEDFALITRVSDPQTRRTQYAAAGFTPFGTEAALSLMANPVKLDEILSRLRSDWPKRNFQIVIRTRVKTMIPGPPELLATHVW